ncbi:hypothetical protein DY000_02061986 [Brassica cretica]|uniref:Aminotransferase-like plant mobile domain-containing protein n=1 Tax=Brassica cretica TaxID=69181 RepID=A0ABQ7B234_BRACR|nr:hypothetical protein DY000_02061986 [Brassica cretica]
MALEKFGPYLPTIIGPKHIEKLYELWGIDYTVEIEAAEEGETPETVRPGYCGAYTSHFQDDGLSFPLPRFLLEVLAELGKAFTQMTPNFWRYLMASWIRAREEGLRLGLEELKQLFSIKRNFPGTMILAPRPGRSVIDEPFGSPPMTLELRGLITTLRRGNPRWLAFTVDRIKTAYALPPGENCATPIGSVVPVRPGKGRRDKRAREKELLPDRPDESSGVGSFERAQKTRRGRPLGRGHRLNLPALNEEVALPINQPRRRAHEEINSASSNSTSSILPPPLRALGEGTSRADPSAHISDARETSSWRFSYDDEVPILENPEGLALIWRKIREKRCELPPLDDMRERDAYMQMAVANAKRLLDFPSKEEVGGHLLTIQQLRGELETVCVTEQQREVEVEGLKGKLVANEAEKVALQTDLDLMKEKHRREIEGCKATALKERSLARRSLSQEYDAVVAVYSDSGFELEEELVRLKDREISLDLDYGVALVSDPSLSHLDLSEVSDDSIDQE